MTDLTDGPYNIQNLEFNIVLGTTAKTSHANAPADHSEAAKGLPRQLAVVQPGTAPPTVRSALSARVFLTKAADRSCFSSW